MKTKIFSLVLGVVVIAGLIFAYVKMSGERALEKEKDAPVTAESTVTHGTNGEIFLTLNEENQQRLNLKTEPLVATNFAREFKGFGRVLDPAALLEPASDLASTRVAAELSQKEFERLKSLSENISARALQTAEANFRRDELAVQNAETKLALAWGRDNFARKELPKILQSLGRLEKSLVRLDLLPGENLPANPTGARLLALDGVEMVEAEFLGAARKIDEQTQARGFLFLTKTNSVAFSPGAAVTGFIQIPGAAQTGVILPRDAIVRHEAQSWIYLKTGAETFVRRKVDLENPTTNGWFISDFPAENPVVVNGAQTLLSEESKVQFRLGD